MNQAVTGVASQSAAIRHVEIDRPWSWLKAGWRDLVAAPIVSLSYGFVFTLIGFLLTAGLFAIDLYYLILPMTGGFLIIGPLAAVGLYEISRRRALGEKTTFAEAIFAWRRNTTQIALVGIALMLMLMFWGRFATIIFMLYFGVGNVPSIDNLIVETFLTPSSLPFLFIGIVVGGVMAAATFAIAAVSIPMLLDRPQANVIDAIVTSIRAVLQNPKAMALWALLIVLFVGAGLATLYIGLIVALPLIGHATWHAYTDLVQHTGAPSGGPAA
ncbi:MAG: DUF2189 domain-containing protein [Geminicoccaceae bacterium]|nr:MAG: DUF2189 domain-containing protein [Geminicoccaceae bacterium]